MTISNLSWGTSTSINAYDRKTEKSDTITAAQILQLAGQISSPSTGTTPGASAGSIEVSSSARNSMYALLGSTMDAGSAPPPPADSGSMGEFMDNLGSLLSSLASGDADTAKNAASALQQALDSLSDATTSAQSSAQSDDVQDSESGPSGFIADVQSLLDAVNSGDQDAVSSAATTLADNMSRAMQAGPPMGPPPPQGGAGGQKVAEGLDDLLSALESGSNDDVDDAATTLQALLDSLKESSTSNTGDAARSGGSGGFLSDVQDLLDAVNSGDSDAISDAAATLTERMSQPPPGGPPPVGPPPADATGAAASTTSTTKSTAETSLETALQTLSELTGGASGDSSGTTSTQTAFLDSLKNLFQALQSGDNVNGRLNAVISAYTENGATSVA